MALEDWTTVDEVVGEVVEAMGLSDTRKVYRPVLYGGRLARGREEDSAENV